MSGRVAAGLALVLALGCHKTSTRSAPLPPPTSPQSDVPVTSPTEPAFLSASATGSDPEAACDAARRGLVERLLGDARWSDVVNLDVHDPSRDFTERAPLHDGTHRCTVGIDESRAAATLVDVEVTPPVIVAPQAWKDVIYAFVYAHLTRQACERRRALLGVDCEAVDATEANAALQALARSVTLAPLWLDGVPMDDEGHALRSPGVLVLQHGVPVASVPLQWSGPSSEVPELVQTGEQGRTVLPTEGSWIGPLSVRIDTQALLGPLSGSWPETSLAVDGRRVDASRWTAVVLPGADVEGVTTTLDNALRQRGLPRGVELRPSLRRRIATLSRSARTSALPRVADDLAGKLDLVVFVSIESRFAGRAAGRRVWYEGLATLDVHQAWTGRRLTRIEVTAKESGISEAGAAKAAVEAVVQAAADRILTDPMVPMPEGMTRPDDDSSPIVQRGNDAQIATTW